VYVDNESFDAAIVDGRSWDTPGLANKSLPRIFMS
jgi:hypothetical protein